MTQYTKHAGLSVSSIEPRGIHTWIHTCLKTYLQKLHESRFGFFSDPHCVFGIQKVVDVCRVNVSQHLFGKLRQGTEESHQRQTTFPRISAAAKIFLIQIVQTLCRHTAL